MQSYSESIELNYFFSQHHYLFYKQNSEQPMQKACDKYTKLPSFVNVIHFTSLGFPS